MKHTHVIPSCHRSLARSCAAALAALVVTTSLAGAQQSPCQLAANTTQVSISSFQMQFLEIHAPALAGDRVQMFGSFLGTSPGTAAFGLHLPLNPDRYLLLTHSGRSPLLHGNLPGGEAGCQLDSLGNGLMVVAPPAVLPSYLIGRTVHHAYGHWNVITTHLDCTSNAVALTFVP